MTAREMQEALNRTADYTLNGLTVRVSINDVKCSFGQVRYLIKPIMGSGEVWVNQDSVTLRSPR